MLPYLIAFFGALLTAVLIWWLHRSQQTSRQDIVDRTTALPLLNQETLQGLLDTAAVQQEPAPPVPLQTRESPENANAQPPGQNAEVQVVVPALQSEFRSRAAATSPPPQTADQPLTPAAQQNAGGQSETNIQDNWLDQVKALREAGDNVAALALTTQHFPRSQALQQAAVILRQQLRDAMDARQPVEQLLVNLYDLAVLADLYRNSNPDKPLNLPDFATLPTSTRERYDLLGHALFKLLNKSDIRALEQLWGTPAAHQHAEFLFKG